MKACFRYLGYTDFDKAYELGLKDFLFMWEAFIERRQDELEKMHLEAWLGLVVQAQKKGKSVYRKFEDFYKKQEKKTVNPELYRVGERLRKYREGLKGGN